MTTSRRMGTLFGVGVGPGDPELLTLKAVRILNTVPVLAWPAPETGPSLARAIAAPHLSGEQREIPIRMPLSARRFPVNEIYDAAAEQIGQTLAGGDDVAVICEGDPFFYGSFMYLYARLADHHRVEVIPGVSSLTACPAVLGTPLSAGNDILVIIPGTVQADVMKERLASAEAAVFIKVGRHLEKIRNVLSETGLSDHGHYVEHATMTSQKMMPLHALTSSEAPYFSMILVHKRGRAWR